MAESEERDWNTSAEGWAKWHAVSERAARPVTEAMLEMAQVEPGDRVLDLATGIGDTAAAAARRVGPSGHVVATDAAAAMLDRAKAYVGGLGVTNVTWRHADLDALDAGETGFDAALCRWGLMFAKKLDATLAAVRRHLSPGGWFAAGVWGPAEDVPVQSFSNRIVLEAAGLPPMVGGKGTPFALSDRAALESAFARAGFTTTESRAVTVVYEFRSAEDYARFRRERSSLERRMGEVSDEVREAAWQKLIAETRKIARPDRSVRFVNEAVVVAGQNAVQQYF